MDAHFSSDEVTVLNAAILEHAGFAIITTDTQRVITHFNRMAESMLGYSAAELVGKETPELFHLEAEVLERAGEFSRQLGVSIEPGFEVFVAKARLNLPNEHEWTYVRKDGSCFPVLLSITALRDAQSAIIGFLGMAVDLTERKRSDLAARNSEQRYRLAFDENPNPMLVYDVNGLAIVAANDALLQLYGYQRDELLGQLLSVLYQECEHTELRQLIDSLPRQENVPLHRRWKNRKRDGAELLVETISRWQPFGDRLTRLVVFNDVTERYRAEQALRESEARLAQILHNSPLPVFVIDAAHCVVIWNPACERVFGVPAPQLLGTPGAWRAFYPSARPVMADIVLDGGQENVVDTYYHGEYRRSLFNPEAFEAEGFFPHMADGKGRWLYFTASPLRDGDGKVVGAIETLVDISERKAAEAQARQLNEELEQRVVLRTQELAAANDGLKRAMNQLVQTEKLASLGNLVAGVAHELNTPLGNMLTVATTLNQRVIDFAAIAKSGGLRRSVLDVFVDNSLEATALLERSAERASELIGSFKEVAVDQTSMRRREFDLARVVDETLSTLRPGLGKTSHQVLTEIPGAIMMDSYPGPLEQILTNFVTNSLLHGLEGKTGGTMRIVARQMPGGVTITYTDDGVGMPEAAVGRAFDPFFTTRLGRGGSGLGLYIVYNLVTAVLGGQIQLTSPPHGGVEFVLTLPLVAGGAPISGES